MIEPHRDAPSRRAIPIWIAEAAWAIGTGVLALGVACWVLRLWDASLRVPLVPAGDALLGLAPIKGMLENGWYLSIPQLGAPGGLDLHDFGGYAGDLPQWVGLRALGVVITDPAMLMNAWFLAGFVAIGAASYLVLRSVGGRRLTSLAIGVLIAVLPYHFFQGEGHLMLAGYVAVPATCWLVIRILSGQPLWTTRARSARWRFATWTNAGVVIAVIIAGSNSLYYAVFGVMLIVMAAITRALAVRSWRSLGNGLLIAAGLLVALAVTLAPAWIYRLAHGPNPAAATRFSYESDIYSFGLGQLLFSSWWSRFPWMSSLGERFLDHSVNLADPDTYLGIVFGAVFVASLVVIALMTARGGWPDGQRARTIRAAIIGAAFAFAIGSFGGVGSIVAHLVSPQIRVWSRITPFLAFFCAIVAVLVIDWARHRITGRKGGRIAAMALPVVIAAVGVLDQTSPAFAPDHVANARLWRETANFVHEVEAELPIGASVLQLPLISFPEAGPVNSMGGYDHLMGYLHSHNLRWSAAAMKGRRGDWQTQAIENGLSSRIVILNAAAAGFDGAWVDRNGYADQGQRVEATITALTGVQVPLVSPTGRIAFYDLRPLRRRLARNHSTRAIAEGGAALTSPITATYDEGFTPLLSNTTDRWRWAAHAARLVLRNPSRATHVVRWTGWLQATPGARVTVSAGGHRLFAAVLTTGRARMGVRIPAARGDTVVSVTSTGTNQAPPGSTGVLSLDVINARLLDTSLIESP